MKTLVLVYNPVSGNAAFKDKLDRIIAAAQERELILIPYRTKPHCRAELADFLKAVRPAGVLAAGGDGTLHETVNTLLANGFDLPLGIIGSGTSNDFASYLRICPDWEKYFDLVAAATTRRVDLGRIGAEYVVNVASAGMLTGIAHEVPVKLKNAIGKLAYYLKGLGELPRLASFNLELTADGKEYELEAFLFVIVNSSAVGSLKNVAAEARVDDGKLDFLAIKKCSLAQLAQVMGDLVAGHSVTRHEAVFHLAASNFTVRADKDLLSDLDGEVGPPLPLTIATLPQVLRVFAKRT